MTDLEQRVQALESEHRTEWREIVQRLTRLETKLDAMYEYGGHSKQDTQQSRQQDRWSGALSIAGWVIFTGAVIAGALAGFLRYLQ